MAPKQQQQKEGSLVLASKVVAKGMLKRRNEGKEDCPLKKGMGTPVGEKQLKQLFPSKPNHGLVKG